MSTYSELADKLVRLRAQFTFSVLGGTLLSDPSTRRIIYQSMGAVGPRSYANMRFPRRLRDEHHDIDMKGAEREYAPDLGVGDAIRLLVDMLLIEAGDGLKRAKVPYTPTFEMMRHVRNAVAHGGAFDIRHECGPAEFDGVTIDKASDGIPLRDVFLEGDLLALYDAVIWELGELPQTD